ncbi:MAG: hypothetical protein WD226_14255 [Planctomycetota bacterium]
METEFPASPELLAEVERLGNEFFAAFYERALLSRPDDEQVLEELAHALTRAGRHAEGLRVDRRLAALRPDDPTVLYNLACSLSLSGQLEEALAAINAAIEAGFEDAALLANDDDLAALRLDPRFRRLLDPTTHA